MLILKIEINVKFHEMDSLLGPVCNSGGDFFYFKIFLIAGLYSVIWYVDIIM